MCLLFRNKLACGHFSRNVPEVLQCLSGCSGPTHRPGFDITGKFCYIPGGTDCIYLVKGQGDNKIVVPADMEHLIVVLNNPDYICSGCRVRELDVAPMSRKFHHVMKTWGSNGPLE
jgi:hypothetical protein